MKLFHGSNMKVEVIDLAKVSSHFRPYFMIR